VPSPHRRTTGLILALAAGLAQPNLATTMTTNSSSDFAEIRKILSKTPLIDGHNDLPWQYRKAKLDVSAIDLASDTSKRKDPLLTDIPRLRRGCVGAQFWSVYVPSEPPGAPAVKAVFEQIDLVHQIVARYPETFALARSSADIQRIYRQGKIASLIGMEGGHSIDNSLAVLRSAYALGARYLTLTHTRNNDWADAAGDASRHHGLTPFGEEVIREMNRLGMLVDLAHVTDETMLAALRVSRAPVIFSHSSARGVCNNVRNVPDDILKLVRENGGVVMVCFLPGYLTEESSVHFAAATAEKERLEKCYAADPERAEREMAAWRHSHPSPPVTVVDVARHIDHIRRIAGIDHVGIGSDFEGFHGSVRGLEDVSCYPALLTELRRRGYTPGEIRKVAGENLLRVFRAAEAVSRELQNSPAQ
jgi:membrane dipeptidase